MNEKQMQVLKPIKIKNMHMRNRMVMPGMGTLFGNPDDNTVSDRMKGYIEARAKGGVGLIIVEYTAVAPGGRAAAMELGIWDDRFISGLKELTDIAHNYGAKIGIQLHHAGRGTTLAKCGSQPVAPSAFAGSSGEVPKELMGGEIKELVRSFAEAARRAKQSGFDCVEIHGAHGYLLSQFMSPVSNKRKDEYGGNFEGRMKFPLELIKAVRGAVGDDYPILFRLSAEDKVDGGRTIEDAVKEAPLLVEAGVDVIDVSIGLLESANWIITAGHLKNGFNADNAAAIKKAVNVPVIVVGKIHTPEVADEIITSGKADMVALGRALLVDPEFPNKVADGNWGDIRQCIHCLNGCYNEPVTCSQNPFLGHEWEYKYLPAGVAKNVVVVGGGPAGLEVAITAAKRCHKVTIFEKEKFLGGQVNAAQKLPFKEEFKNVIDYRIRQAKAFGVDIRLGQEARIKDIKKCNPDVVVIATGATHTKSSIQGLETASYVFAKDLLQEDLQVGKKVVVIGGGSIGSETTHYLIEKGHNVTLVEMEQTIAGDVPFGARVELMKNLKEKAVLMPSTIVKEINNDLVVVEGTEGEIQITKVDNIVLAVGMRPYDELSKDLKNQIPDVEVYVIGDAKKVRKIQQAVAEGLLSGLRF